ncbi:MAG: DNA gyrase subunit A, partial [Ruthenibacterium sp.]
GNMIEVTQIPPTTTIEAIMDKIADLVKSGRVREVNDMRDETDLNGLKLTIDLKRGQDPEKVMQKLLRMTPLEDSFFCNFNILIAGMPRVMGVREILTEWTAFRTECVRRRTYFDLTGKQKRLNLLRGLEAILLDIDKAVRLVRETEEESEVVPNLMIGFGIDKIQAEYVAEIKLRHLNREYILKRTQEISELEAEILRLKEILDSPAKIKKLIVDELAAVAKKYGEARRSEIIYEDTMPEEEAEDDTMPDYPVTVFYTREGYFKKITPQSLRMSGEQKLKEGDVITRQIETKNNAELLFFTSACQVYKCRVGDFEDGKASAMGDYIAARLGMDDGEIPLYMALTSDYKGSMLFLFANGKVAKVPLESYATKQNRKKLLNAFSDKAPLAHMEYLQEETELAIETSAGRLLLVGTAQIPAKLTKNTAGVNVITLKKNHTITSVRHADTMELANPHRYRVRTLPAAGAILRAEDLAEQTQLTL